jgi:hypothetical protein
MEIQAVKYVKIAEVFTEEWMEWFNASTLPFTFGDCKLSLITPEELFKWLNRTKVYQEVTEDEELQCESIIKTLHDLDKDNILISL